MPLTLKAARVNKGLTQAEAAKKLGVRSATLSKYENGKTFPSVKTVKAMVTLYNVPFDDIIFLP